MNTRVAPLLLGGAGPMTRAPGSHTPIIRFANVAQGNPRRRRLLLERLGVGEFPCPGIRIARRFKLHADIGFEALIGRRITPTE